MEMSNLKLLSVVKDSFVWIEKWPLSISKCLELLKKLNAPRSSMLEYFIDGEYIIFK